MAAATLTARGLLAALAVLAVARHSAAEPEPGRMTDLIMKLDVTLPHPSEYLRISPQTQDKIKRNFGVWRHCLGDHLKKLPGAVAQAAMVCVPSAPAGVAVYASCVAGKGLIDAAAATNQIITCANTAGPADKKNGKPPPHGKNSQPPHHGPPKKCPPHKQRC